MGADLQPEDRTTVGPRGEGFSTPSCVFSAFPEYFVETLRTRLFESHAEFLSEKRFETRMEVAGDKPARLSGYYKENNRTLLIKDLIPIDKYD